MSAVRKTVAAAVVVVVALVGYAIWSFLSADAPARANLADAVQTALASGGSDDGGPADAEVTGASAGQPATVGPVVLDGVWTVASSPDGRSDASFAGFRIKEELIAVGSTTAVGRTPRVTGAITLAGSTLTEATFEVDLTTVVTNDPRRDSKVQAALRTAEHPTATFRLTAPVELGEGAAAGEPVAVSAPGELTLAGATVPVTIAVEAQLVNDAVVLVGRADLTFADFGVEVPDSPSVISVDDHGELEVQLLLTRG